MAVIKIDKFGGEIPALTERLLPVGAAKTASGLLPTVADFRPLGADESQATGQTHVATIFRAPVTTAALSTGWLTNTAGTYYAAGAVRPDGTQHVYYGDGTDVVMVGSVAPSTGAMGTPWQLGVPKPTSAPGVTATRKNVITLSEVDTWLNDSVVSTFQTQLAAALTEGRDGVSPTTPATSGDFTFSTSNGNIVATVLKTTAESGGLNDPQLGPATSGNDLQFFIACRPLWGTPATNAPANYTSTTTAITHPISGSTGVLTAAAAALYTEFKTWFAASDVQIYKDRLTQLVADFKNALTFSLQSASAPPAPTKPTDSPEYVKDPDSDGMIPNTSDAAWVTYRAAVVTYNSALTAYNTSLATRNNQIAARNARILAVQTEASEIMRQVEAIYQERKAALDEKVKAYLSALVTTTKADFSAGSDAEAQIIHIAPERIRETRFYVATAVNTRGEESAPSAASAMLDIDQYYNVTVTRPTLASGREITKWRLYRSNSGTASTAYQFVKELNAITITDVQTADTSYNDTKDSSELGESLSTTTWDEPPKLPADNPTKYLKGLTWLPTGAMAGFIDSTVYFSELGVPYAWPTDYQYTLPYPIMGIIAFGQTLFVATTGIQYTFTGSDPASMNRQEIPGSQSCISARSIAALETAVIYASPDGLCLSDFNGIKVLTKDLFTRKDWQDKNPATCVGAVHDNCYVFFFTTANTTGYSLSLDTGKLVQFTFSAGAVSLFAHRESDRLYAGLTGNSIHSLFSSSTPRSATFKTGIMSLERAQPMAWMQVVGEQNATTPVTVKLSRGNEYLNGLSTSQVAALTTSQVSVLSNGPLRLPSGLYSDYQLEITSAARIASITLAGSTEELKQV